MLTRIALIVFMASGCASSSLAEEYCTRLDSCNILRGSVEECVQDSQKALDSLSPHQRDEVEYEFKQCLDRPSCDGFRACVSALGG